MSGWDNIDPMAGKVASQINGFANAPVFWDMPKDRAVALAIVEMVRKDERERHLHTLEAIRPCVESCMRGDCPAPKALREALAVRP